MGEDDVVSVAPYKDQLGRRMMFYKIGNWIPDRISIGDILKTTLLLLELASLEPQAQVLGGVGIFDLEGFSLSHAWYVSPSIVQKIISLMVVSMLEIIYFNSKKNKHIFCFQTCMPHRTEEIHIINNGWAFDVVFQMFKPFLNERMRSKIFLHGWDLRSFHKHIYPQNLPEKYGGEMPKIQYTAWIESFKKNTKILNKLEMLGYVIDPEDLQ